MSDELTKNSIHSFMWKTMQSICSLGITFVIQLILARMLMPEDFGLIAIVNVFMTLANTVVETSFSSAIIQRNSISQKMLSSVFFVNIFLSVFLYGVLFLMAPLLSVFYEEEILIPVLRVQGLRVVISAVYSIQQALMNRKMRFKALFFCNFAGVVFQAITGIAMAYCDMGIWALVLSSCVGSAISGFMICVVEFWVPELYFSLKSVREALSFSSKILAIRVIKKIYYNIRVLVIGKIYDAEILGYFNKGLQFPSTAMTVVDGSLTSVAFTHLSKLQDEKKQFLIALRQYVRCAMFLCTPLMVGMILIAKPLILFLLTERWIACVPYLQIICLSHLLIPLSIKATAFEALGRSDISMKLNLTGVFISIVFLFALAKWSPLIMVSGEIFSNFLLQTFIAILASKYLQYSIYEQLKDAFCGAPPTAIMACGIFILDFIDFGNFYLLEILAKITAGVFFFVLVSIITKNQVFFDIVGVLKNKIRGKRV